MKKKNKNKDLGFEVPQGYFKANEDRLFDLIAQGSVGGNSPFDVPAGYFDDLENRLISMVHENADSNEVNKSPFTVPPAYFENLEDTVMKSVSSMQADNKESPFTVPEDYFETLENRVFEKTVDQPVVKLESEYPSWVLPMLAIAAIFIAVMVIDGLWGSSSMNIQDLDNEELAIYLAETDFTTDLDAMEILYSDTDVLDNSGFQNDIDNDVLVDYLTDEMEMSQMIEE